jgi:hypothetical protein
MKQSLIIITIFSFLISCNKDKFDTKPKLTFKKVNSQKISKGEDLVMTLNATDSEGDLTDSILVIRKTRNCAVGSSNFKQLYKVPIFPTSSKLSVDFNVTYGYANNSEPIGFPQCNKNDSCIYRFVIRDKAGNWSDTAETPEIVVVF